MIKSCAPNMYQIFIGVQFEDTDLNMADFYEDKIENQSISKIFSQESEGKIISVPTF